MLRLTRDYASGFVRGSVTTFPPPFCSFIDNSESFYDTDAIQDLGFDCRRRTSFNASEVIVNALAQVVLIPSSTNQSVGSNGASIEWVSLM